MFGTILLLKNAPGFLSLYLGQPIIFDRFWNIFCENLSQLFLSMSSWNVFKEIFTAVKWQNLQMLYMWRSKMFAQHQSNIFNFLSILEICSNIQFDQVHTAENWINPSNICFVKEIAVQKNWYSYLWMQKIIHDYPPICAQQPNMNLFQL